MQLNEIPGGWPKEIIEADSQPDGQTDFDTVMLEMAELDLLLSNGLPFQTPVRSALGILTKRTQRNWKLKALYLGTLDRLGAEYIKINFSEQRLKDDFLIEMRRLETDHALGMARIVAIALINSYWGLKWLTKPLAWYLSWHLTPGVLFQLVVKIGKLSNHVGFCNSIRLMFVDQRTTTPALIENPEAGLRG